VNYAIVFTSAAGSPASAEQAAASISDRLAEASPAEVSSSISAALVASGRAPYDVTVTSITAATVAVATVAVATPAAATSTSTAAPVSDMQGTEATTAAAIAAGAAMFVFFCFVLVVVRYVCKRRRCPSEKQEALDARRSDVVPPRPTPSVAAAVAPPAGTGSASERGSRSGSPRRTSSLSLAGGGSMPSHDDVLRSEADKERGWAVSLLPVDSPEWGAVVQMLRVTDARQLGAGRDVREKWGRDIREPGRYTKLIPICAWHVEAPFRQSKYLLEREEIRHKLNLVKRQRGMSSLPDITTKLDAAITNFDIDPSVCERFLWHGTTPDIVTAILQNGMNERFSDGHFGKGTYLAEDAAKMDQYVISDKKDDAKMNHLHECLYTSQGMDHPGKVYYAFACRTILGFPAFTKDGKTTSECIVGNAFLPSGQPVFAGSDERELAAIPEVHPLIPYHSMVVECGPAAQGYALQRHREFVITHATQILPEFLVAYRRG